MTTITKTNLSKAKEKTRRAASRIVIISAAFPPIRSGESEHALYLCRQLSASGLDVHVLTGHRNVMATEEAFTVHAVMRDWNSRDMGHLINTLCCLRPDAVLLVYSAWAYNHHPMITLLPLMVHRFLKKPFVTQFEFVDNKRPQTNFGARAFSVLARAWGGAGTDWFYGTLLRDSDRIIVLDNRYRDLLAKTQPDIKSKSILIPPPPLLHILSEADGLRSRAQKRAEWKSQQDDFVVAFFGYIYPGKGVETLLRAAAQVPHVRIVLVGGELADFADYSEQIQLLVQNLGIADRVVWTGYYPSDSDEPSRCLWAADACALPFEDGITVNRSSFAAAAAHSLPIITTRGDATDPMFVDGDNVLLCPPRDPDALACHLNALQTSPDLRLRLHAGIQQLTRTWFSWETAVDRTLEALSVNTERQTPL